MTRRHVWQHTTKSSVFYTPSKDAIIVALLSVREFYILLHGDTSAHQPAAHVRGAQPKSRVGKR